MRGDGVGRRMKGERTDRGGRIRGGRKEGKGGRKNKRTDM